MDQSQIKTLNALSRAEFRGWKDAPTRHIFVSGTIFFQKETHGDGVVRSYVEAKHWLRDISQHNQCRFATPLSWRSENLLGELPFQGFGPYGVIKQRLNEPDSHYQPAS
jgi:hypothetical protein